MKITRRQLRSIAREAIIAESPTMVNTGMTSGGKGPMPGIPKKSRDSMVKELRIQLDDLVASGKTKNIPPEWLENYTKAKEHDMDPKFSLYRDPDRGGPTDEDLMALSKALNPSMFTKFKKMIGMKEGKMRLTESQLRRIVRESILREALDINQLSLKDLEYEHDQLMGHLSGQASGGGDRKDIETMGEDLVDMRDRMTQLRSEQGLPEKDYSDNGYRSAENVVQGEIKFRKRGY